MAPEFHVFPEGASYSSGKMADLFLRDSPFLTQIAVVEADDKDSSKFQFKFLTVDHGRGTTIAARGGYSKELACQELSKKADDVWIETLKSRFGQPAVERQSLEKPGINER